MSKIITLSQAANLIAAIGHKRTVLVQGPMGSGKSSLIHTLAERFPNHAKRVIDVATMMDGELAAPCPNQESKVYDWLVNSLLVGNTPDQPILVMFDEIGKAQDGVLNAIMTALLDRRAGMHYFPEGSIICASTNLSEEGLGDFLMPHHKNRIVQVRTRAYSTKEWVNWSLGAGIHPIASLWLEETFSDALPCFTEVDNPDASFMCYHPKLTQDAFLTHRSLHAASDVLWARDMMDNETLLAALEGAIGVVAGGKLFAHLELFDKLPKMNDIVTKPDTTFVPDDPMIGSLLVFNMLHRAASTRDKQTHTSMSTDAKFIKTAEALLTYCTRLEANLQHMFCLRLALVVPGCAAILPTLKQFAMDNRDLLMQMDAK